jgi:small subunit ribosomal protein S20
VRRLIAADDLDGAEQALDPAIVSLDKAAQKGVLHRNNTSRRKSRLIKMLGKARDAAR